MFAKDDVPKDTEAKPLGTVSLAALVVASMIGAGVFTTSGFALADLRDPWLVMAAWAVGGIIALCGAISYSQLIRLLTESGGEYVFLSRFLHPAAGFVGGWVSMLAGFTGAGAYAAVAFESYALPIASRPEWLPQHALAIILTVLLTTLHAFHTRRGALGQNFIVAFKMGMLVVFVVVAFGLFANWQGGQPLATSAEAPDTHLVFAFAISVMWISLSYCGFNAAVYVAEEARDGARSVGRAMIGATICVTILYGLLNTVFLFGPASEEIAGQPDVAAIAAESVGGAWFAGLVRATICLGLASSVSSVLLAGPRVYAKMAADGLLPRVFRSIQSPPTRAVLLQGIAIILVVLNISLRSLLSYLGLTLALVAALTVSTLFLLPARRRLRESGNHAQGRFSLLAPFIYVSATFIIIGLTAWAKPQETIATVATVVSGLLLYWFQRR
jgi:amino acid transporter